MKNANKKKRRTNMYNFRVIPFHILIIQELDKLKI